GRRGPDAPTAPTARRAKIIRFSARRKRGGHGEHGGRLPPRLSGQHASSVFTVPSALSPCSESCCIAAAQTPSTPLSSPSGEIAESRAKAGCRWRNFARQAETAGTLAPAVPLRAI